MGDNHHLNLSLSNQTYNVARGLVRANSTAGGARRIIFTNNADSSIVNRFVPGSGVGGMNMSVKNHLRSLRKKICQHELAESFQGKS